MARNPKSPPRGESGRIPTALTIAGSDPSGGAGVQGDLKTFAVHGVYGLSAITAITAQATDGVVRAEALPADLVTAQLETLAGDLSIDAVKTGMLADAAIVEAVGAAIQELDLPNLVVDPVIASSGGVRLLDADGVQSMISELFPRARVITPNVPEAEALSGRRIASLADARDAARRLHAMGPAAVIVTGGHARWPGREGQVIDLLFDGRAFVELRTRRVAAGLHGTGCAFASAVTAALAMGAPIEDAAAGAQRYVARLLAHPLAIGRGGALDHMRLARRR